MAALNFPANPTDGQLYPDPAQPGQQQYVYSSVKSTWQTVAKGVAVVYGQTPVVIKGSATAPVVTVNQASSTQSGYITPADYNKIQKILPFPGTVTEVTAGVGLSATLGDEMLPEAGGTITTTGTLNIIPATRTTLGGVIPGAGLSLDDSGVIAVTSLIKSYAVLDDISPQFDGNQLTFELRTDNELITPNKVTEIWVFLEIGRAHV